MSDTPVHCLNHLNACALKCTSTIFRQRFTRQIALHFVPLTLNSDSLNDF